jgi:hypothetical protein
VGGAGGARLVEWVGVIGWVAGWMSYL